MKKRQLFVLPVLMAVLLSGCKKEAGEVPVTEYSSLRVTELALETVDRYPATFRGRQDVDIVPQVSGKIISVDVREGQRVRKGQTLFVIDQIPYRAALQTAQAVRSTRLLMTYSDNGSYLEVLTAQQSLLSAQLTETQERFDRIQGIIKLYHALGGG